MIVSSASYVCRRYADAAPALYLSIAAPRRGLAAPPSSRVIWHQGALSSPVHPATTTGTAETQCVLHLVAIVTTTSVP